MTELNYLTPSKQNSTIITRAWITLLVLGSLYGVGGLCIGTSITLMYIRTGPPDVAAGITFALFLFYFLGVCAICIWASLRVRLRSRLAVTIALVACIINATLMLGVCILGIVALVIQSAGGIGFSVAFGGLFYLTISVANALTAVILYRARKSLGLLIPITSAP